MQNFNKQQPKPKINIPKTPQQLFIKKADDVKQDQHQHQHQHQPQIHLEELKPIKTVKYIDELYSATFLDNYFH
jgi:ribosomal protein L11